MVLLDSAFRLNPDHPHRAWARPSPQPAPDMERSTPSAPAKGFDSANPPGICPAHPAEASQRFPQTSAAADHGSPADWDSVDPAAPDSEPHRTASDRASP